MVWEPGEDVGEDAELLRPQDLHPRTLGQLHDALAGEALVPHVEVRALAVHQRPGEADDRVVVAGLAHHEQAVVGEHVLAALEEPHVVAHVVQAALAEDHVEGGLPEGHVLRVRRHEPRVRDVRLAHLQHLVTDVEPHSPGPLGLQLREEEARSAANIEEPRGGRGGVADHLRVPLLLKQAAEGERVPIRVARRQRTVELDLRLGVGVARHDGRSLPGPTLPGQFRSTHRWAMVRRSTSAPSSAPKYRRSICSTVASSSCCMAVSK